MGRKLRENDFGAPGLSYFTKADLGSDWKMLDADVVHRADKLAQSAGVPVKVSSGYRSPAHNRAVGGAPDSLHVSGRALDLWFTDGAFASNVSGYISKARALGLTGIGIYHGKPMLHVDNREKPGSWAKLASGKMVSLSEGLGRAAKIAAKGGAPFALIALLLVLLFLTVKGKPGPGSFNA